MTPTPAWSGPLSKRDPHTLDVSSHRDDATAAVFGLARCCDVACVHIGHIEWQNPVALDPFPGDSANVRSGNLGPVATSEETGSPMCGITDDGEGGAHP